MLAGDAVQTSAMIQRWIELSHLMNKQLVVSLDARVMDQVLRLLRMTTWEPHLYAVKLSDGLYYEKPMERNGSTEVGVYKTHSGYVTLRRRENRNDN